LKSIAVKPVNFTMSISDFDLGFDEVVKKWGDLVRQLPNRVSNLAANDFKDNFKRQGYRSTGLGINKWKKRAKVKNKRDASRAILVKSGRLRRGIQPSPQPGVARVINKVPYANAHNEGSKETVKVKAHKRHKWKTEKVKVNGRNKKLKQRTAVIKVKSHSRKMNLPPRRFMVTTQPLLKEINAYISAEITKIL
jgi:phage gpG-like protein